MARRRPYLRLAPRLGRNSSPIHALSLLYSCLTLMDHGNGAQRVLYFAVFGKQDADDGRVFVADGLQQRGPIDSRHAKIGDDHDKRRFGQRPSERRITAPGSVRRFVPEQRVAGALFSRRNFSLDKSGGPE
jgi:hypothetical protein